MFLSVYCLFDHKEVKLFLHTPKCVWEMGGKVTWPHTNPRQKTQTNHIPLLGGRVNCSSVGFESSGTCWIFFFFFPNVYICAKCACCAILSLLFSPMCLHKSLMVLNSSIIYEWLQHRFGWFESLHSWIWPQTSWMDCYKVGEQRGLFAQALNKLWRSVDGGSGRQVMQ